MPEIILASASPRRAELLKQLGLDFTILSSEIPEEVPENPVSPGALVTQLALQKALEVSRKIEEGLIIGADTIVVLNGTIFGKPSGPAEAVRMLAALSGKTHSVFTGLALVQIPGGKTETGHSETRVKFRKLGDEEIEAYVATGEPLDKAGAYGIQGKGGVLVEAIDGCYFNVVGLPLSQLAEMLRKFQISIWQTK